MRVFAAFLAVLWLPVAAHCQLESMPGLEFISCQSGHGLSENPTAHCDAGCCSAERSLYKTEESHAGLSSPDALADLLIPVLSEIDGSNSLPEEVCIGILTASPPHLLKTWQFASRAALPVRAPSLAS